MYWLSTKSTQCFSWDTQVLCNSAISRWQQIYRSSRVNLQVLQLFSTHLCKHFQWWASHMHCCCTVAAASCLYARSVTGSTAILNLYGPTLSTNVAKSLSSLVFYVHTLLLKTAAFVATWQLITSRTPMLKIK